MKLICHFSNIEFFTIILIVVLMFIWSKGPYRVIEGPRPSQKLEGGVCRALNFYCMYFHCVGWYWRMAGRPKSDSDSEPKVLSQAPGIHKSVAKDVYFRPQTDPGSPLLPLQGQQFSSQSLNITISYITNIYTYLDPHLDQN